MLLQAICQYSLVFGGIVFSGDSMKPLKTKISITLDEPVLTKVQTLAEKDDRSLSSYINLILREHLETLEKNN